jgi:hypothetical protein
MEIHGFTQINTLAEQSFAAARPRKIVTYRQLDRSARKAFAESILEPAAAATNTEWRDFGT